MRHPLTHNAWFQLGLVGFLAGATSACVINGRPAAGSSRFYCDPGNFACVRCFEPYGAAAGFCGAADPHAYCTDPSASQTDDCKYLRWCEDIPPEGVAGPPVSCMPGGVTFFLLGLSPSQSAAGPAISAVPPSATGGSVTAARSGGGAPRLALDLASGEVFAADPVGAADALRETPRIFWNGAPTALVTGDPGAGWRPIARFRPELLRDRLLGEGRPSRTAAGAAGHPGGAIAKRGFTELAAPGYPGNPAGIATGPDGNLWLAVPTHDRIVRMTPSGQTTAYALTLDDMPFGIAAGPDGALWFTLIGSARIGRVHPTTGALSAFSIRDTSDAKPAGITAGPDGNLWFTMAGGNKIGRLTPSGTMAQFDLLTANANPLGIVSGPDGNLWFTEMAVGKIGKITPAGVVTEYPLASATAGPAFITAGSDGNLWFTETAGNAIGRITPGGTPERFPLADPGRVPYGIAAGPDGRLWFTELEGDRVSSITTAGTITPYTPPTVASAPALITAGPDGALWFTEYFGARVGRVTTAGAMTEYAVPLASAGPTDIVAGADGNLWFLEATKSRLVRMAPNGALAEFVIVGERGVQTSPTALTVGPDFNFWFTDQGLRKIGRATPAGEITLFSIPKPEGSSISPTPTGIVTGPDQSLWFTDYWGSRIGRMTIAGDVTLFDIPKPGEWSASPLAIASGPDGNLWFTDDDNGVVSKITTSGVVTPYTVPGGTSSEPFAITRGPDGNLWFTERSSNRIGRITPAGTITEFEVPTSNPDPGGITAGADGNLWFTERYGNGTAKLGRITPAGVVTEITLPDPKAEPFGITNGPDGALWFTERVASKVGRLDPNQLEPPTPPAGEWLTSVELPGFQVKVQIAAGASPLVGQKEEDCIADTLCVSGALAGRPEVFVRVVGPKPNGYLWPTLVKFSTSQIDVWVQQIATEELRYYLLPAVDPGADLLNLAGLADKLGFESASAEQVAESLREPVASGAVATPSHALGTSARGVDKTTAGPPPPGGPWLTSPDLPGFLAKVRITASTVFDGVQEPDCIDDTLCVSGALPGRPEVFVRVVGPKPNGYLWPTLVKFSTSQIEVWVEQESTGVVQYYLLPAVDAGADLLDLAGVADKLGFVP